MEKVEQSDEPALAPNASKQLPKLPLPEQGSSNAEESNVAAIRNV